MTDPTSGGTRSRLTGGCGCALVLALAAAGVGLLFVAMYVIFACGWAASYSGADKCGAWPTLLLALAVVLLVLAAVLALAAAREELKR